MAIMVSSQPPWSLAIDMNETTNIIAGTVGGFILAFGVSSFTDQTELLALQNEKHEVLKSYVYAQARIGEVPTLDLSIVSQEEYVAAFSSLVEEKQVETTDPNLFIDLQEHAKSEGVACK